MHKDFCVTMKQPFSCSVGITHVVWALGCSRATSQWYKFKTASVAISELFMVLPTERREPEQVNRNVQQQQWKWIYTTFYFRVTWEWRQPGGRDSKHLYSWKHPETTNTRTAFFPCFTSSLILVQWLFSSPVNHVSYLGCDNAKTIHVHQTKKELSMYCQIHHHLSHPWRKNVGRRKKMPVWRTEEVRITREREGEERGRKHTHALLCKGEKPQRTDITACGPLSRIEMPPPHRWRQSEFFTPSQSTAHVIVSHAHKTVAPHTNPKFFLRFSPSHSPSASSFESILCSSLGCTTEQCYTVRESKGRKDRSVSSGNGKGSPCSLFHWLSAEADCWNSVTHWLQFNLHPVAAQHSPFHSLVSKQKNFMDL